MPLYDYYCTSCGLEFEDSYSIKDRKLPTKEKCPTCNEKTIKQSCGMFSIGDAIRMGITKPSAEFQDVLQKIHDRVGRGSRLDKKMSQHQERKRTL